MDKLGQVMTKIINDDKLRMKVSKLAISNSKTIIPRDNARALTSLL